MQKLYRETLFAARLERQELTQKLAKLDEERTELNQRVQRLTDTIEGLAALAGESPITPRPAIAKLVEGVGLADACRIILIARNRFSRPVIVRDMLERVGYDFGEQANPLASIHSILKRFEESGEAESLDVDGKVGYRLKKPDPALVAKLNDAVAEVAAAENEEQTASKAKGPVKK